MPDTRICKSGKYHLFRYIPNSGTHPWNSGITHWNSGTNHGDSGASELITDAAFHDIRSMCPAPFRVHACLNLHAHPFRPRKVCALPPSRVVKAHSCRVNGEENSRRGATCLLIERISREDLPSRGIGIRQLRRGNAGRTC